MEWLLLTGGAVAAGTYVLNEIDNVYQKHIGIPVSNYIKKEKTDSDERLQEEIRQVQMERKKEQYKNHQNLRNQYNLKPKNNVVLINNSEDVWDIIYVNHYKAVTKAEAIVWAKKKIESTLFDGEVMNKLSTKKITLGVTGNIEIIESEWREYFIVLHYNNDYIVLDRNKIKNNQIKISQLFESDIINTTDVQCKWF